MVSISHFNNLMTIRHQLFALQTTLRLENCSNGIRARVAIIISVSWVCFREPGWDSLEGNRHWLVAPSIFHDFSLYVIKQCNLHSTLTQPFFYFIFASNFPIWNEFFLKNLKTIINWFTIKSSVLHFRFVHYHLKLMIQETYCSPSKFISKLCSVSRESFEATFYPFIPT